MWLIVLCTIGLLLLDLGEDDAWRNTIASSLLGGTAALALFVVYLQWYGDGKGGSSAAVVAVEAGEGEGAGAGAGQDLVGGGGGGDGGGGAVDSDAAGAGAGAGDVSGNTGGAAGGGSGSGGGGGGGGGSGGDVVARERKNVMSSFGVKKHKIAPRQARPAPLPTLPTPVVDERAASEPELELDALSQPHGLFANAPDVGLGGPFAIAPTAAAAATSSGVGLFSNAPIIGSGSSGGQGYTGQQTQSYNGQQTYNRQQTVVRMNSAGEQATEHRNGTVDIVTKSGRHFTDE